MFTGHAAAGAEASAAGAGDSVPGANKASAEDNMAEERMRVID
jgi:hypothetical protein